eukprot:2438229-Prymnesium_polylepis.1
MPLNACAWTRRRVCAVRKRLIRVDARVDAFAASILPLLLKCAPTIGAEASEWLGENPGRERIAAGASRRAARERIGAGTSRRARVVAVCNGDPQAAEADAVQ